VRKTGAACQNSEDDDGRVHRLVVIKLDLIKFKASWDSAATDLASSLSFPPDTTTAPPGAHSREPAPKRGLEQLKRMTREFSPSRGHLDAATYLASSLPFLPDTATSPLRVYSRELPRKRGRLVRTVEDE
jgi:hypothetical protein